MTTMTKAQRSARATRVTAGAAFYATGAATIAANMYASAHTPLGLATGFWTPVALFLALEMVERVHVKGRWGLARKGLVAVIALVAAWQSYWHLVDIFAEGGADAIGAHAMPITVDILMVLARTAMNHRAASPPRSVRRAPAKAKPERKLLKVV